MDRNGSRQDSQPMAKRQAYPEDLRQLDRRPCQPQDTNVVWGRVLYGGYLDSFVVVRTLSLVCHAFRALAHDHARIMDLHSTLEIHELLASCVLPRYPSIARLSLKWTLCTDATLALVAQHLPRLTHLNLHGCKRISDDGCKYLAQLSQLQFLDLSFCPRIGDFGLQHLRALRLESLKLNMCRNVTDGGLLALQDMPSLLELGLSCTQITSVGLLSLANNSAANLHVLDLSGCAVDDASVAAVLKAAPRLWYVTLAHCKLLTTHFWQLTKSFGLTSLRVLELRGNRSMLALSTDPNAPSARSIERQTRLWSVLFAKQCPHLAFLNIASCDCPPELKKKLMETMPKLVVDDGTAEYPIGCSCESARDVESPPTSRRARLPRQARPH
ncbi:hypothetical protein SDRG_01159 [Saprolegnia diclina VS20]|uniref:F-box/LRR-repeat protein 15-like leucin rich repeat domain-containing protein n=1 Tax=Saprolegnia diclina (strain VS20) TaxID=1156394 RepID=T0S7R0_SAPDV|nr:hypothetical protein SDRG_01159 [Saprolegnia diclina VS20]EQC41183.1 hypothetical protein SDRG_01159 [Saprolegnia diclina VS20]|eukprot:XP_008604897.1 hypothetical protein SDRG_01159 [Saprolegnia diclina VS20]